MAPSHFPTQGDLFYDRYWTEYVDLCFVVKLEEESARLGQPLTKQSHVSITRAQREVNFKFTASFGDEYCIKRFIRLEDRFQTFRDLISMPEVIYDAQENVIHADPEIWDMICMNKELGIAYREQGDPCWAYLQRIFGEPLQVDPLDSRLVINISSDYSESQPHNPGLFSSSQTANSATPRRPRRSVPRATSTGRSGYSATQRVRNSSSQNGGSDNPSSQASCSWADVSREF